MKKGRRSEGVIVISEAAAVQYYENELPPSVLDNLYGTLT